MNPGAFYASNGAAGKVDYSLAALSAELITM